MGLRGPAPTPTAQLKLRGSWRAKQREKAGEPQPDGMPKKPRGLPKEAAKLWDAIVPQLVDMGVAKEIDTTIIRSCCEFYALYRGALAEAEKDPLDKNARIAVISYATMFDRTAAKLGMSPSDRTRLRVEPEQSPSRLTLFARQRGEEQEIKEILGF